MWNGKPLLQGKMARQRPPHVNIEHAPLPLSIYYHHKEIQQYMNFFYINGFPLLHTRSGKINFRYIQSCVSISKVQTVKELKSMNQICETRGFKVIAYRGGNNFDLKALETALIPGLLSIFPDTNTLM